RQQIAFLHMLSLFKRHLRELPVYSSLYVDRIKCCNRAQASEVNGHVLALGVCHADDNGLSAFVGLHGSRVRTATSESSGDERSGEYEQTKSSKRSVCIVHM